jgi:hypothetical protein
MLNNLTALLDSGAAPAVGDYESIATVTGTGSSATLTFSSIPSTYKHLQVRGILRSDSGSQNSVVMRFNSDSGSNYARHVLSGNGSSASASAVASGTSAGLGYFPGGSDLANLYGALVLDVLDYTSTNKNKTTRTLFGFDENGSADGIVGLFSSLWFATPAAITDITITAGAGNWTTATTLALYGVK